MKFSLAHVILPMRVVILLWLAVIAGLAVLYFAPLGKKKN